MTENQSEHLPIDRGWAWVVCAACFIESFVVGGVFKSFGLFFVEYMDVFDASASSVSLIMSVQSTVGSISGLFAMTIGPLFCTERYLTYIGGVLVPAGYIVNAFAPNISVVTIGTGLIFGFGLSFTHGPATVMLGKYFKKRRGFANAMYKAGSGVGSFAFPPVLRYLLDTYGLHGALLIVAGFLLNVIPCGALLRPTKFYERQLSKKLSLQEEDEALLSLANMNSSKENNGAPIDKQTAMEFDLFPYASSDDIFIKRNDIQRLRTYSFTEMNTRNTSKLSNRKYLDSLSTNNICMYASFDGVCVNIDDIQDDDKVSKSSTCDRNNDRCQKFGKFDIKNILAKIFAKKLLQNKLMLLFLSSTTLSVFGIALMNFYIPPHAKDCGIDDQKVAILVSIYGGADLTGRFAIALIADVKRIRRCMLVTASNLIAGGICMVIPFFTSFWSLALFSATTGLCAGFYFAILAVVLIDFVGIQNLASAYGMHTLSVGMSITITSPILGAIRDKTSSYIGSFYLIGSCILAGGLLLLLEPCVRKYQNKRNLEETEESR